MKNPFILILTLLSLSAHASAEMDLPLKVKKIIFDEMVADVFFEDEGFTREPSNLNDFVFKQIDEFKIKVVGKSYSSWDMKEIGYDCTVEVLTRGQIKSSKDVYVSCQLEGENWPND